MIIENNSDYLISIEEACENLHCGKSTVYGLLQSGKLDGFRINRRWKIPRDSIQKFIYEQLKNNTCRPGAIL